MSSKKSVSIRQLERLIMFMENNNNLAHGMVRSTEGRVLAHKLWQQCADILNAEDVAKARTPKEWNKFYNDYKSRMKNKLRILRHSQRQTVGGPSNVKPLSPLEERLCAIVGEDKFVDIPVRQNPIEIDLENTANVSEPIELLCTDQELPGPPTTFLNSPSTNNINIDCPIEANIIVQEDTYNRERNKKNKRKESELEKAENKLIEIEKEKMILQRQHLEIEREKMAVITSLANATRALVNVLQNQNPVNGNTSTEN